ncbi:hypothetical protein [Thermodesulfitimonas sp.]
MLARQVKAAIIYRQGRVVAPTPEEAVRLVEEKYPDLGRITLFPCPVQLWPGTIWWEWVGETDASRPAGSG